MAAKSNRRVTVQFSEDVIASNTFAAAENDDSPAVIEFKTLAIGANTITPPAGGSTPVACTIIPPAENTTDITLKGVTGDTGIVLHNTDPTSIALDNPLGTFVLTAAAEVAGVRLVWS